MSVLQTCPLIALLATHRRGARRPVAGVGHVPRTARRSHRALLPAPSSLRPSPRASTPSWGSPAQRSKSAARRRPDKGYVQGACPFMRRRDLLRLVFKRGFYFSTFLLFYFSNVGGTFLLFYFSSFRMGTLLFSGPGRMLKPAFRDAETGLPGC